MEKAPIAWIPLGAIEWHGWHAPVGLDALTSSGLCKLAANDLGGVALPPLHYGAYASISSHPWTILLDQEDCDILLRLLLKTLSRLEELGVKHAVILTGHFAAVQGEILNDLKEAWESEWRAMKLIILNPDSCPNLPIAPDHGGLFETSLLKSLEPEMIDLSELSDEIIEETNPAGPQRRDPSHPLYGIIGADPRGLTESHCKEIREHLLTWMIDEVNAARS
ncbi:creatininase family protein [Verrucomicrobiaceae bacterium N1E253]|uniref:Creatininase family protein n=2 Tax=Oceaniferula marina TaxID=2748318 RepID=A0A851GIW4_9BACT|nr:creatininase family protein [Oceaniferula marina]